jgi:hypothetical protein
MSQENELSGEPRNTYINSLILVARQIEYNIFFANLSMTKILPQLRGIIYMLDANSKEKLKDILATITRYEQNLRLVRDKNQIWNLYSEIMDYLHTTYLLECRYAKPKFGKTNLGVPKRR